MAGLAKGGQQLKRLKANYQKAINLLVELASLQTSFITLDEVIKTTNRRVNAIEHVIIPRIERTLAYIISELGKYMDLSGAYIVQLYFIFISTVT